MKYSGERKAPKTLQEEHETAFADDLASCPARQKPARHIPKGSQMAVESYAVLGGEGFVGQAIVQELLVRHPTQQVASFGLTQRTFTPGYRFFHTVSPHVSASAEVCQAVNVEGTKVILEACVAAGVTKLVFTSSMTVSFDSHPLINADERMPGLPNATDCYVASKVRSVYFLARSRTDLYHRRQQKSSCWTRTGKAASSLALFASPASLG